jgi:tetratricopeptide (TPR) repeat protein
VVALVLAAALTLCAAHASAQEAAAAEALFNEGRALLDKGDYDKACVKLVESQRLDPSSGTAINVALCHRKQGKIATAWADYKLAARLARQQGKKERAEDADKNAAELEKQLSYLTIEVPSRVPGLEVRRDDVKLEEGSLGSRLPVDPGTHVVTASAPGYRPVTLEISIGAAGGAQVLTVPQLDKAPDAAPTAATTARPASKTIPTADKPSASAKGQEGPGAIPWIVGGLGAASLIAGGVFGGLALKTYSDAKSACPSKSGCSQDALDTRSRANLHANIANVAIPVGVVGIGVAAALLLVGGNNKGSPEAGSTALVPAFGPGAASLSFTGVFQ